MISLSQNARVLATLLILFASLLRLPWLTEPPVVVFDEVHFGKFATAYCCTHEGFFDIHPPHAKLLTAAAAWVGGYRTPFPFNNIGDRYPNDLPVFFFRLVPALAGILLPVAMFAVPRLLGASLPAAFAAGLLIALDNAVWVQTRFIALDGVLWLSMLTSVACLLQAQRFNSMRRRVGWLALCGVAMGMAVGTKFTGLTTGVVILGLMLNEVLERRTWAQAIIFLRQCIWIGFPFALTYLAGWAIHFVLLSEAGPGDAFYRPSGEFFRDVVRLHEVMLSANYGLAVGHPDASVWWTWPFMAVPVFYWAQGELVIYLIGNPLVWWGSTAVGLTALMIWLLRPITRLRLPDIPDVNPPLIGADDQSRLLSGIYSDPFLPLRVPAIGFVISLLPLAGVPRSLFLYHYVPSLCFALLFAVAWLERCGWTDRAEPLARQPLRYWGLLGCAVIGFVVMLPISGGIDGFSWWRTFLFQIFPLWP